MATLTVSISEKLELNGKNVGGEQLFSVGSITQAYQRIVTCPANNDTTVATFQTAVHTADNAIDLEDAKYIRVTNIDETNELVLSLQISNNENGTADGSTSLLLAAGQSFVMGVPHEGVACDSTTATPITDTAMHDLESIIVDPKTNDVIVEVFIAS